MRLGRVERRIAPLTSRLHPGEGEVSLFLLSLALGELRGLPHAAVKRLCNARNDSVGSGLLRRDEEVQEMRFWRTGARLRRRAMRFDCLQFGKEVKESLLA